MEASTIGQGREAIRAVRERLLHPSLDTFAACLPELEIVARSLEAVRDASDPELGVFRREVREAEALLKAAGQHYFGWIPADYSANGLPVEPSRSGSSSVSLEA